jgi:L-alanine-DL-glutamate epimerase-like enolase superfamily enzyme
MRITAVDTWVVSVPFRFLETWVDGQRAGINNVVIRVSTDEGVEGWGEAAAGSGGSVQVTETIVRSAIPLLLGLDPHQIEEAIRRFYGPGRWRLHRTAANTALAGLEMALWDIVGKSAGQPLCNLLGGALRDRLDVYAYVNHAAPEVMAESAREMVDAGHTVIYLKAGEGEERDYAVVSAVRAAVGPRAKIRIDVNEAWTVGEAVRSIQRLSEFDLDFVEQPVSADDVAGMALLRQRLAVPIAINQGTWTLQDVYNVLAQQAADVVVIGLHWVGGVLNLRKAAAIAEAAGVPVVRHSSGELGIAAAAGLHVLAAVPNQVDGHQTYHTHLADDIVADDEIVLRDGCQRVPMRPGLGVTVDPERLEKYSRQYQEQGPYLTYSVIGPDIKSGFRWR